MATLSVLSPKEYLRLNGELQMKKKHRSPRSVKICMELTNPLAMVTLQRTTSTGDMLANLINVTSFIHYWETSTIQKSPLKAVKLSTACINAMEKINMGLV